jgi:hypothetical protein
MIHQLHWRNYDVEIIGITTAEIVQKYIKE